MPRPSRSILVLGARHDRPTSYAPDSPDAPSDSISDHSPMIVKGDADLCHPPCSTLTVIDAHRATARRPARDAGITHRRQGAADYSLCGGEDAVHARNLESLADFQADGTDDNRQQTNKDAL